MSSKNNELQIDNESNDVVPQTEDPSPSRNTPLSAVVNNMPTQTITKPSKELVGHDTCTTTDEQDAIEALLALGDLPDNDTHQDELTENENLMPIPALM